MSSRNDSGKIDLKNHIKNGFYLQDGIGCCERWMGLQWLQDLMYSTVFFH